MSREANSLACFVSMISNGVERHCCGRTSVMMMRSVKENLSKRDQRSPLDRLRKALSLGWIGAVSNSNFPQVSGAIINRVGGRAHVDGNPRVLPRQAADESSARKDDERARLSPFP
jgi:hypothetical protein